MTASLSLPTQGLPAGDTRAAGSNAPLLLDDPAVAWSVLGGGVDVFVVPTRHGQIDGRREYLFHAEPGSLLPGFGVAGRHGITLVAVGGADSAVAPVTVDDLRAFVGANAGEGTRLIEQFVRTASAAFLLAERNAPRVDLTADTPDTLCVPAGAVLSTKRDMVWISVQRNALDILGNTQWSLDSSAAPFPLAPGAWMVANEDNGDVDIVPWTTRALIDAGTLWESLRAFEVFMLSWAGSIMSREERARAAQLTARMAADAGTQAEALSAMASVMASTKSIADRRKGLPLLAAMEMIGAAQGIQFRAPTQSLHVTELFAAARTISQASSIGYRRVVLDPQWWTRDVGPLLGFLELRQFGSASATSTSGDIEQVPVALLPSSKHGYDMVNPETGSRSPVTAALAAHLSAFGVQFSRGLPGTAAGIGAIWRFVTFGARADLRVLLMVAVIGSFLGLLLPLLSGYLFDDVIPSADHGALLMVLFALVIAQVAGVLFEVTRSIAVMRLHTRLTSALQLAVIDRLIHLPAKFFRGYSVGDLGQRTLGINAIGAQLGGATLSAILSSVVSAGAIVLLFYYSIPMALLCCAIVACYVALSVVVSRLSMRYSREHQEAAGHLSGLLLELLHGIAKLRVAAAEARAFAQWSNAFRRQQEVAFAVGMFSLNIEAVSALIDIVAKVATFGLFAWLSVNAASHLTTGQFLAFSAAAGMFVSSALTLTGTAVSLLDLIPTWQRVKPLLQATPEANFYKPDPGILTGHIEVSQVNFSYEVDGPAILTNVSIDVAPGKFIALVGPSGSGKSTLLRILLGFERHSSGAIRFDGQELSAVDVTSVRRQIGVVLQNATLTAGNIFDNIVGASALTHTDAMEAARMAGFEDDLRALPMGLHTLVSEGGGTLSGGQRQRLLIARALVTRPRILFLDEATSALDNRTQRIVSDAIESLHATRVVVAHRLSTVRRADCIYVLESGRVVESGQYDELIARGGLFSRMAARQEA